MFRPIRIPLILLFVTSAALAQTTVPLNTGYNHANFTPYPAATSNPSIVPDQYWAHIAAYPPIIPAVGPSSVVQTPTGWTSPMPQSHWINGRDRYNSASGVSTQNPGYTIFRKCFCLLPNYKNPSISFRMRADDNVEVWFNSVLNKMVNQTIGNWWTGSPVIGSLPSNPAWFRVGRNCIYVLVEDVGGFTGFTMSGSITADGLLPVVAIGDAAIPCCTPVHPGPATLTETNTIEAIRKVAEERRKNRKQILRAPDPRQ